MSWPSCRLCRPQLVDVSSRIRIFADQLIVVECSELRMLMLTKLVADRVAETGLPAG